MIVNSMVKVIENGKKLILQLSHSLSVASSYAEIFLEETNVNIRKIKHSYDMNIVEDTYEIEPLVNNAKIVIMIKDDDPFDLSYHIDRMVFQFDGQKWTSEDRLNPNYH